MHNMEVELVLTGPRAGQTVLLNGHFFRRGVARIKVSPDMADPLLTYMGRAYQAYLQGSEELAAAQQRDEDVAAERRKAGNGVRSDLQANPSQQDGASTSVQSAGERAPSGSVPDPRALHGGEHVASPTGSEGMVSGGSGHEDSGLGDGMVAGQDLEPGVVTDPLARVRVAVAKLDVASDEHWTDDGLPAVAAIADALHDQGITRPMIDAAAPGFTRLQAQELAGL